jgi:hypothetical protein
VSGYVRDIVIKKDWDGDKVTLVLRPVSFDDMLAVSNILVNGKAIIPVADLRTFLARMKPYTKTLSGLKAYDGSEVSIDELFDTAYFIELLTDVIAEWLEKGIPANPSSPGASLTA